MQAPSKKRSRGLSLKRKAGEFSEGHAAKKPCKRTESADDKSPSSLLSEHAKCELAKLLPCPHPLTPITPLPPSQSVIPDSDAEAGDEREGSVNSVIKWTPLPPPDLRWLSKQPLRPLSLQQLKGSTDSDSRPQSSTLEERGEVSSINPVSSQVTLTQAQELHPSRLSSRASTGVSQSHTSNSHSNRPLVSTTSLTTEGVSSLVSQTKEFPAQFATASHCDSGKNRAAIGARTTGLPPKSPNNVSNVEMELPRDQSGSPPQITGKEEVDFDQDFLDDDLDEVLRDVIEITDNSSSSSDDLPAINLGTAATTDRGLSLAPSSQGPGDLRQASARGKRIGSSTLSVQLGTTAAISTTDSEPSPRLSDLQQASASAQGKPSTLSEPSKCRVDKLPLHTPEASQLSVYCPICNSRFPSGFSQLQTDEHIAMCLSGFLSD